MMSLLKFVPVSTLPEGFGQFRVAPNAIMKNRFHEGDTVFFHTEWGTGYGDVIGSIFDTLHIGNAVTQWNGENGYRAHIGRLYVDARMTKIICPSWLRR